jgi:hypothetical protein
MKAYKDPNNEGNSEKYHTGEKCIKCKTKPAGTYWSLFWCFECNVKRMDRISEQLNQINEGFQK